MSLVRSSTKWRSQKEKRRGRRRSSPASPSVGVEARGISPVAAETKGGGGGFSSYRSGVKVGLEPALVRAAPSGGGREAAGGPVHLPQYNL
jgi:hypothetical protein